MKLVLVNLVKVHSLRIIQMEDHLLQAKMKLKNISDTVMEYNTGSMELIMKDNGDSTKQKVKELSGMPKAMFTAENSKMIWQTDMANIPI